ncbi:MAG: thioredoxin family protein [Blastocatellia bacterium]|nr:thioredoxin family protein [Blastocatellia bacterium]
MKKNFVAITLIALASLSIAAVVLAQLRNISRQRTPTLTTEDVRAKPSRETTRLKTVEPVNGEISWQKDIDRALDMAKSDGKLVVVDVYTDWCGWCKKMDQVIYSDPLVVGLSRQQVFLKLDAEDGGQGQQFARRMGVRGYPTTMVLDGNGRKLKQVAGFIQSPQKFVDFVESARAGS